MLIISSKCLLALGYWFDPFRGGLTIFIKSSVKTKCIDIHLSINMYLGSIILKLSTPVLLETTKCLPRNHGTLANRSGLTWDLILFKDEMHKIIIKIRLYDGPAETFSLKGSKSSVNNGSNGLKPFFGEIRTICI